MRVRPRKPEGADRRPRRPFGIGRPVRGFRGHAHRQPFPIDVRAWSVKMQMLRNHPSLHRQHDFDQASHARRPFQVADARLDRTDQQRAVRLPSSAVHRCRGVHLDRVRHLRPHRVRFQVIHFRWRNSRPRQGFLDELFLRRTVGDRQPRAGPVLIHRRAPDDTPDAVTLFLRIAQPLQNDHTATLAAHETVRGRVERPALPIGGQHPVLPHESRGPG